MGHARTVGGSETQRNFVVQCPYILVTLGKLWSMQGPHRHTSSPPVSAVRLFALLRIFRIMTSQKSAKHHNGFVLDETPRRYFMYIFVVSVLSSDVCTFNFLHQCHLFGEFFPSQSSDMPTFFPAVPSFITFHFKQALWSSYILIKLSCNRTASVHSSLTEIVQVEKVAIRAALPHEAVSTTSHARP